VTSGRHSVGLLFRAPLARPTFRLQKLDNYGAWHSFRGLFQVMGLRHWITDVSFQKAKR
jgi:hypothetical protein